MQAVILAAGTSSNFWPLNPKHKSLMKIMGKPLICYTLDGLARAGVNEVFIVQGPQMDIEKGLKNYALESSSNLKIKYLIQKKPEGMGDALFQAEQFLKDQFFVLGPERIEAETYLRKLSEKSEKTKSGMVLLASHTKEPWLYGIFKFKGDKAEGLIEKPKHGEAPSDLKIRTVYLFHKKFFEYYKKVEKGQYNLEAAIDLYVNKNDARIVITGDEPPPLKYPWDLFLMRNYLFNKLLKPGIAKTSFIAKNAIVEGQVVMGENAKILGGAVIKGPCYIGKNCIIGTNSLIRDYTDLEQGSVVGAMAEVTRSIFQENVHIHSGFIGDSILDDNCWVGAGVVTANKRSDKRLIQSTVKDKKIETNLTGFGSIVGQNTKIGIHASLMPGVMIGSDCVIGPHSLVMENVADNNRFYTQYQGVIKRLDR